MVLVTGGTGFLGSYIIKKLVAGGHTVRAIRRSVSLPFYISPSIWQKVEWVDTDVLDVVGLREAMNNCSHVIHSAAIISFGRHNRQQMYKVNIEGTANVVNAALDAGIQRFLHVSSVASLGRTVQASVVNEDKRWEDNIHNTHYAITKHHAEREAWRGFAEGLKGVIINPSTILGFGNWHQGSSALFKNVYRGFDWYTEGLNGFVGVEDAAEAAVQLLFSNITEKRFIVNAENRPFREVFSNIARGFGKKPPHRKATRRLSELAWRAEALKAAVTGAHPLITKETARVAHSHTSFDNRRLLQTLPSFQYKPLDQVIEEATGNYLRAMKEGILTL